MRLRSLAILAGSLLLSGCYHIVVTSGATPGPVVVDRPWQHSFIGGLVPPPELNVKELCPNGVAKVETLQSAPNILATIMVGVYTPVAAKVTCAAR